MLKIKCVANYVCKGRYIFSVQEMKVALITFKAVQ